MSFEKTSDDIIDTQFEEGSTENPLNFSLGKKWLIVSVISFGSFTVTCCSSMIAACYEGIQQDLHVSHVVAALGISCFVLGLGSAPLVLGPLSEFQGRRNIYVVGFFLFAVFNFGVAFAPNIGVLLLFRFLSGLSGSAFLSVAGGSVTDLFKPQEVSNAMAFYTSAPFNGPCAGPIIASFIAYYAGWRWVWYVQIIWAFAGWVAIVLFVPETYARKLLGQKAARLRKETGNPNYKSAMDLDERSFWHMLFVSCYKPFEIMLLEPMALFLNIWTALLLGILYAFFSAFDIVFLAKGWPTPLLGLSFTGLIIGNIIGAIIQLWWTKRYGRLAGKLGRQPDPEAHLERAIVGGMLAPLSLIIFAFTSYPHVHWSAPIIATIPFGLAMLWIYSAVFTYLVDAFRPVAASALASNSFLRSTFAAAFPLFSAQLYNRLPYQFAGLLLAMLLLVLAPLPIILYKRGHKIRKQSKFSQTVD